MIPKYNTMPMGYRNSILVMLATIQSHLLSKNVKIRIYKTIILPVVPYGCETLSLTLREEHRLGCLRTGC
jgi:hypothetical protein